MARSGEQQKTTRHDIKDNIYTESIRLVYASTPMAAAAIVVAVAFLAHLFNSYLPKMLFWGWVVYMLSIAAGRMVLYLLFRYKANRHHDPIWSRLMIASTALTGIGWGACSLLFFNLLPFSEKEVLILVVVAYTAGSLTTMFTVMAALASLLLPAVVPLIFLIFSLEGSLAFSSYNFV